MKKILVPTDFSVCADHAANTALSLAKLAKAELHFLHLMPIPIDWLGLNPLEQKKMYPDISKKVNVARSKLNGWVEKAARLKVNAKQFLHYNESYEHIIDHIESHGLDFVIMGSQGADGVKEVFVGSNTQRVVRLSKVPVLVVKGQEVQEVPHIVFASDFEEDITNPLEELLEFAKIERAKVHFLFVNTPFNFLETKVCTNRMRAYAKLMKGVDTTINIYNAHRFEDGLLTFAETVKAGIIAMTTHGRKGISRFVSGSLTENVINHVEKPVLSISLN